MGYSAPQNITPLIFYILTVLIKHSQAQKSTVNPKKNVFSMTNLLINNAFIQA